MIHNQSGYLIDSNIAFAILDNDPSAINLVRQAQEEQRRIYFSTITECEVLTSLIASFRRAQTTTLPPLSTLEKSHSYLYLESRMAPT